MFIKLTELIDYWKDKQKLQPPITPLPWSVILSATILFLEELKSIQGEQK